MTTVVASDAREVLRDALASARDGRRDDAVRALSAAIEPGVRDALIEAHLALLLVEEDRVDEAAEHAAAAAALGGDRPATLLFAGRVLWDAARYAEALAAFDGVLKINPANDLASGFRTLTAWAAGDMSAASFLRAESLTESSAFLARLLALIEGDLRGRKVDYVSFRLPPWMDRVRVGWMLWRGASLRKSGRWLEALNMADMASELAPGFPPTVRLHREIQAAMTGAARRAVDEQPESSSAHLEFAERLADAEEYGPADEHIQEAARLAMSQGRADTLAGPDMRRLQGVIALGLGRADEAVTHLLAGAEPGFNSAIGDYK